MTTERAVLAGGCFWGMQDLIRKQPGVDLDPGRLFRRRCAERHLSQSRHPCRGDRDRLRSRPRSAIARLLEFFFQIHDPTTENRQGNDIGHELSLGHLLHQRRTQKAVAEDTIADVDASGLWPGKVVTEVAPAGDFWEAEPEHQDYLERIPNGYTCHFVRPNWKLPRRADAA